MFSLGVKKERINPNQSMKDGINVLSSNTIFLSSVKLDEIEIKVNKATERIPARNISIRYLKNRMFNIFVDYIFRIDDKPLVLDFPYTLKIKVIVTNSMKDAVEESNKFRQVNLADGSDFFMIPDPLGESVRTFEAEKGVNKTPYVAFVSYRVPLTK